MPLPIWAIALVAGAIGHMTAQEKNDNAQRLLSEAKMMYESTKNELEKANRSAKKAISDFKEEKEWILWSSFWFFERAYEKIKPLKIEEMDSNLLSGQLESYEITPIEMQQLTDIYNGSVSSAVAGAAVGGAAVAAGSAEALSLFGGSIATVGAIAAPIVAFTAIDANITADENLSKAKKCWTETEVVVEKMRTEIVKCDAVKKRIEMYLDLMKQLNDKFYYCAFVMHEVIEKKLAQNNGVLKRADFTKDEIKLFAVTRALAGAMISVLRCGQPVKAADTSTENTGSDASAGYEPDEQYIQQDVAKIKEILPKSEQEVCLLESSSIQITRQDFERIQDERITAENKRLSDIIDARNNKNIKTTLYITIAMLVAVVILPVPPIIKCLVFCIGSCFLKSSDFIYIAEGVCWLLTLECYAEQLISQPHFVIKSIGVIVGIIIVLFVVVSLETPANEFMNMLFFKENSKPVIVNQTAKHMKRRRDGWYFEQFSPFMGWSEGCISTSVYAIAFQIGLLIFCFIQHIMGADSIAHIGASISVGILYPIIAGLVLLFL